jgi:hypothetical protein
MRPSLPAHASRGAKRTANATTAKRPSRQPTPIQPDSDSTSRVETDPALWTGENTRL